MKQIHDIKYFNLLVLVMLTAGLMALSACSTTEDEAFESAFDTPITSSVQDAMNQSNISSAAPRASRMLTRDNVANMNDNQRPLSVTTRPLSFGTRNARTQNTRTPSVQIANAQVAQAREEQPQLDWSRVKRWSGAAQTPRNTAPRLVNPPSRPQSESTIRLLKPIKEKPIESEIYTPRVGQGGTSLAAGDTINLTVYGEEELSGEYLLDNRGSITVPLIGVVQAAGLSKTELQDVIAEALKTEQFLEKPYVTVTATRLQPFYILGEVRTPGRYDYEPTLDVFKAIALAGGYTPRAAKSKIIITRLRDGQKTRFYAVENTDLLPGDSILVKQRFF